ncbi:4Fe-4S double cluster binding domain-containing protein [Desulfolutivibrio sulfoxidireducens]|uniref:4Fe-4S double cluster binding domain-containing protein n=1 Tax=Desulfolutivibrio sulfoxidireducens TaxID=2773299 RepID=UPI00159EA670|nr:4Fe-4S double cluster binding domain-containing protein [Desulfolutivibrio sulfoxidireducens]QLA14904.1 4Fe-4S dicluster domain-containing protein [Desulfolutivibrio sulfoxidireducens]QLA18471.1 4Fe-4S dicluster domain-containing protein [Desulfolutivibrio sulfoxidireducens]
MDAPALKRAGMRFGASIVGVADLALLQGIETSPPDLLEGFTRAVSVAVRLSNGVMDAIKDRPTPLYRRHYDTANILLDQIALRLTHLLMDRGARALPLPASQSLDQVALTSYLSHKAVAIAAGIGWQGKSLLVVNPRFGPRIRLVTVLTDAPLAPDAPVKNRCGACSACAEACPAGAIKNVSTVWHYKDRDEALHFRRCADKVTREFKNLPHVESTICGVCVSVCPWGRRK